MNIDMRHFVPAEPVTAPRRRAASPPKVISKRLDNVRALRDRHTDVRLLTAYANGPDRNMFILRVLTLFDSQKLKGKKRHEWAFLRRIALDPSKESVSQVQIIRLAKDLGTTPRGLVKLMNPVVKPRPLPEIDWELDGFKALLAYARREPLTLYHELRVLLVVKKMSLTVFSDRLRPDFARQQDAACWCLHYLKKLTSEERLRQALEIVGITPNSLLLRLPHPL
ncbi:MAG: hypothetical protein EON60_11815 [Alphaproteobacteria bacterium]|nr:MAG: hypothetical protein EON60_11815 [Alphaproteobacteria bacterium]